MYFATPGRLRQYQYDRMSDVELLGMYRPWEIDAIVASLFVGEESKEDWLILSKSFEPNFLQDTGHITCENSL